jgi:hypothetical protein
MNKRDMTSHSAWNKKWKNPNENVKYEHGQPKNHTKPKFISALGAVKTDRHIFESLLSKLRKLGGNELTGEFM